MFYNNHPSDRTFSKKIEESNLIRKVFFSVFFAALFSTSTFGQEIQDLDSKLTLMLSSQNEVIKTEGKHLKSLISDLLPSIYFQQGELAGTYKENPIVIFTDIASILILGDLNPLYKKIEIISIRIKKPEDLQTVINLSNLSGFDTLKYIYFLCDFNICPEQPNNSACANEKISAMIQNSQNPLIEILYKISIGS